MSVMTQRVVSDRPWTLDSAPDILEVDHSSLFAPLPTHPLSPIHLFLFSSSLPFQAVVSGHSVHTFVVAWIFLLYTTTLHPGLWSRYFVCDTMPSLMRKH